MNVLNIYGETGTIAYKTVAPGSWTESRTWDYALKYHGIDPAKNGGTLETQKSGKTTLLIFNNCVIASLTQEKK
ncbi:hypothetical protein R6G85_02550 [Actinotignum urinale]|uniref:hypothetical protein n=1 Tax=Actinotignum urinale TaxID=190146 RepID=UPI002A80FF4C|nr:hypothetical protein [Actinotignum urinale]MDY5151368.1 hypothetical protein [Actinotignum urinale]